ASAPIPPQLAHVFLSTSLAAGSRFLRVQLPHRLASPAPLHPSRHFFRGRSSAISSGLVSTRRSHRHDQLVSRSLPLSSQISRQNRPRPHTHPLGRTRRLPSGRNGP